MPPAATGFGHVLGTGAAGVPVAIDARAADGAIFNPNSQSEDEGWGVYVTAGNVINAGKVLSKHPIAKGATFDPYVKSGK